MKCSIAKDLLSLYAEQICSAETSAELEEHLKECEECRIQLEHYRSDIVESKEKNEDIPKLNPMKKVSRKLKIKTAVVTALCMLLAVIVGCIGVLSYGEITNYGVSFSLIADYFKLKNVSEKLADGDTQALVDVLCFTSDNYYFAPQISGFENRDEYKALLKKQMDQTYQNIFAGRDITVKASDIMLNWYEDDGAWNYEEPFSSYIDFSFCEGDNVIITLGFAKVRNGKFAVFEYENDSGYSFTGDILPSDEILMNLMLRTVIKSKYDDISATNENVVGSNGWKFIIDGIYGEDNTGYADALTERVEEMYSGNCIPKDAMYAIDSFDDGAGLWVYKMWVEYENTDTASSCIAEYKFYYHKNNLYVIPDHEPVIISADGNLSDENKAMILGMFG